MESGGYGCPPAVVVDVVFEELLKHEEGFAAGGYGMDAAVDDVVVVVLIELEGEGVAVALGVRHEVGMALIEAVEVADGGVEVGAMEHIGNGEEQGVGG